MGFTSAQHNEGLGRRDVIKRSAAIGLVTVPTMSFLASCASSDSGTDKKVDKGKKSAKNPLGVNDSAPLDFVVFDGGFGTAYAKDAITQYEKAYPKAKVKFSSTEKIQSTLQPRFNGGTPPDLIDNNGAEQMDMGVLVGKKQLADLTPLFDAPSYDDPAKKVRDTLRPGVVEMGQFDGDPVWIMYYAYTVYGVWYSQTALDRLDAEYPEDLGRDAGPLREGQEEEHRRAGRTPASTRTTSPSRSTRSSARSAVARSWTPSTTWSRTPGSTRP